MTPTSEKERGPFIGARHVQALLLFFCLIVNYMVRLNVAVAVVAMTNAETTNPNFEDFNWNEKQKSYILSSFYWGYVVTQFPGGYMCRKFGAKFTILFSTLGSSVLSFITPVCIPLGGWQIYCAIRVLQGMFQGLFYPCILEHLAKWSPIEERTRLGALSHTGMEIGTILAMAVTGLIAESNLGWPGISYISGGLGVIWCVFWLIFADNNPIVSRFISPEEKKYILVSQQKDDEITKKKIPIPWKGILSSIPFISLVVVRMAEAWGYSTIQAEMPSYLRGVFDMNIKSNALFSGLPYLAMFVLSYVYLIVADIVRKKKVMSLTALRKIVNSIAMWVPAVALVAVGFLDENQKLFAIVLMIITVGVNGGVTIGSGLNAIDLSSNHAAILIGIINTVTSCVSLTTPLLVGVIVIDETDRLQWQIVFMISALTFFLGNLQYVFFGTSETQPWNAEDFFLTGHDIERRKVPNDLDSVKPNQISVDFKTETKGPIDSHISCIA